MKQKLNMIFAEGSEQNKIYSCLERCEKHTSKWKLSYLVKDHDVCSLFSDGSKKQKQTTTTKTHSTLEQESRDKAEG